MQTNIFLFTALFSAVALVAGQDSSATTTKPPTASQTSEALYLLNKFNADVRTASDLSDFSSYGINALIPTQATDLAAIPTITAASEFTALPSAAQSVFSSIYLEEVKIVQSMLQGAAPQPTGILLAAGAAAAGVLGVAAML